MARIVVKLHGAEVFELKLESGNEYIAGRAPDCAIQLQNERGISRQHLKLTERDGMWVAESLATRGYLLTPQQIPLQPRTAWRPITPDHSAELVARFTAAADASTRVQAAVRDLGTAGPTPEGPLPELPSWQRTVRLADTHGLSR